MPAFATILALSILAQTSALPAQEPELTVERIWSDPPLSGTLPASLTWLPDGSGVLMLEKRKVTETAGKPGTREVTELVRIDAETGERSVLAGAEVCERVFSRARTEAARPTGRPGAGRLRVSPDGRLILLELDGDVQVYELARGELRRLTASRAEETLAAFSPDGARVGFVRDHDLFSVDLETGLERQLTWGGSEDLTHGESDWVHDEELDLTTGFWWAPDGERIAYLELDETPVPKIPIVDFLPLRKAVRWQRYPKAGDPNPVVRVGVVGVEAPETVWLETGVEEGGYVARVDWTADASTVAVQVLNRRQNHLRLLLCDPGTGESRPFLEERSDTWIDLHDDLRFLEDGRVLWATRSSGFRHLVLHDREGNHVRALTSGAWSVAQVEGVDEERGQVSFTASGETHLERHLFRAPLRGGPIERVTGAAGTHTVLVSPTHRHFVATHSTAARPLRIDLFRASGEKVAAIAENPCEELRRLGIPPPEFLSIRTSDGLELPASIARPPDFDPARRHPVLLHVYGGPLSQLVRDAWGGSRTLWHHLMARKGYVVLQADNRASGIFGMGEAGRIHRRLGEVELGDIREVVRWLKEQPWVDGSRIVIWGWSYGGTMAATAILKAPDLFKAAVAVAPVTDWASYDTIYTERYMDLPKDNPEGYEESSLPRAAGSLKGRLLIVHGAADDNVHLQNTMRLVDALIEAGRPYRLLLYPRGAHGIGGAPVQKHLFASITEFLLENL